MEIKFNKVNYLCTDNATYIKEILSNINLNIKEKCITSIMGCSGSGKTALIELLKGLIKPTKGDIYITNGYQERLEVLYQDLSFQFVLDTVYKEISFAVKYQNKNIKSIKKHVIDSLLMVGLNEDYLYRKIDTLSSGEKRLVALASILSTNPKILVLDEPTVDLDNKSIENLISLIRRLKNRYGKTIIILSKDSDFVHKISDEVVILNEGRIVLSGDKYEVFKEDLKEYGIKEPKIIQFEKLARLKNIRLLYRDEINDLMKDIYRYVK